MLYKLGSGGMVPVKSPSCQIGQRIRYTGDMANQGDDGIVIKVADTYVSVILDDGRFIAGVHELPSESDWQRGQRFHMIDGIASSDEVADYLARSEVLKAQHNAKKAEDSDAFTNACAELKAKYPQLILCKDDHNAAAKNMRKLLKASFPGIKFSVKTSRYAGGSSIDVRWTDGPLGSDVEEIANRFAGGSFDGMQDLYEYSRTPWTTLFGDEKYIFCRRDHSTACIQEAIDALAIEYNAEPPTVEQFNNGDAYNTTPIGNAQGVQHWSWQQIINRKLAES